MAIAIYNGSFWLDGYAIRGSLNAASLETGVEGQDDTAFGDITRSMKAGLKTASASIEGYYEAGTDLIDPVLFTNLNLANKLFSASQAGADGDMAYFMRARIGSYAPGGAVGDMLAFSATLEADDEIVRATIMAAGSKSATANGTARQLGAVTASQKLYAGLHVISGTGTLDVTVESDDNSGFTSGVTRGTFTQATGRTSEWLTPVAGAITDDWWRVAFTIGTGPFDFVVMVGIQ